MAKQVDRGCQLSFKYILRDLLDHAIVIYNLNVTIVFRIQNSHNLEKFMMMNKTYRTMNFRWLLLLLVFC